MDVEAFIESVTKDSAAIEASAPGHLAAPVPSCPDWDLAGLVGHLGGVYSWAALALAASGERPVAKRSRPPEDQAELLSWFGAQRDGLVAALGETHPEDAAWNFAPLAPNKASWWSRRQALETAVHRFDAELAAGIEPGPIPAPLAVQGIEEFLGQLLPAYLSRQPVAGMEGTLHVHCTDTEGEWLVDFGAPDLGFTRAHARADTALRGSAADLYLWLWQRLTTEAAGLEVFGDPGLTDAWKGVCF